MVDFLARLAKINPIHALRILKKVIFGSPVTEFTDPPLLQLFFFYIPRAENPLFLRLIICVSPPNDFFRTPDVFAP